MNIVLKATLLSGLVYPGAGHYILRKKITCVLLVCAFTLPLLFLFNDIFNIAQALSEQITAGEIPLDIIEIRHHIHNQIENMNTNKSTFYLYSLGAVWLFSIVDSYRIARKSSVTVT